MFRGVLLTLIVLALLSPVDANVSVQHTSIPQPKTIFVAGPGTIVSVRRLDLPFASLHYAVKYKLDTGDILEIWTPANGILLMEGMHGMLTYSRHPERILKFTLVGGRQWN